MQSEITVQREITVTDPALIRLVKLIEVAADTRKVLDLAADLYYATVDADPQDPTLDPTSAELEYSAAAAADQSAQARARAALSAILSPRPR